MKEPDSKKNWQSGFTLVEVFITIAVLAILITIAAPSFNQTIERRKLEGAAEELYAYLQFARSESIKRATDVMVSFENTSGTDWCYGLKVDDDCDCEETDPTDSDYCAIDGIKKIVNQDDHPGINIDGSGAGFIIFDHRRGTADNAIATFVNSYEISVDLTALGRVKICGNNDTSFTDLPGYPPC